MKAIVFQMILHWFLKKWKEIQPDQDMAPHLFWQQSLNDLVWALELSKEKAELFASRYKRKIFYRRMVFVFCQWHQQLSYYLYQNVTCCCKYCISMVWCGKVVEIIVLKNEDILLTLAAARRRAKKPNAFNRSSGNNH